MTATNAFALSGTVKDDKGVAIAGASVSLVSNPAKKSTSSANGEFSIDLSASSGSAETFTAPPEPDSGWFSMMVDSRFWRTPHPFLSRIGRIAFLDGQWATLRDAVGKAPRRGNPLRRSIRC